ncbi:hypothetical protein J3B02_000015 [Coemansia erecta]|uniref:Glutathione S-transferase n=1 Tax=Coemansia asiatica TaxID=1052880 RepID=A0A9W8CKL3_9FUNG|nr:hypothetical protein LPJ64_002883 [Coemansia asiatica]KAJ2858636.1 hypothetical protein J3B02_000015 [Coemansia erecta]KAJ2887073.1 hypothetical protein FB639_001446 [Coemansia asiatica]
MSSFVLRYFPVRARAETTKAILSYANADWTQESPAWPLEKQNQPVGKLPVLTETLSNGTQFTLCESLAIEGYLAKKFGLSANENPQMEARQMELRSQIKDIYELTVLIKFAPSDEVRQSIKEKFLVLAKAIIEYHEKVLEENGSNGHYFGDKITYVDLAAFATNGAIKASMTDIFPKALEMFSEENAPLMNKVFEKIKTDPKMTSFIN